MGWLITLGILTLLAIAPLGVSVGYDSGGAVVRIVAGPVRLQVLPQKKKKPKQEKSEPKPKAQPEKKPAEVKQPRQEKKAQAPKKAGGKLQDFLPLVQLALDFLGDFRRKLRVNRLELNLVLAGSDPCDLAVNYGRAWAALGNLMPHLENWFVIKKRDIEVECDFEASETVVIAHLDLTITIGRLFTAAGKFAVRALKEFMNIKKKRKGGAVK